MEVHPKLLVLGILAKKGHDLIFGLLGSSEFKEKLSLLQEYLGHPWGLFEESFSIPFTNNTLN